MPKRIGILTLPLNNNYGGILQAVALFSFLSLNGIDVIFLNKQGRIGFKERLKRKLVNSIPFWFFRATAGNRIGRRLRDQAPDVYDMIWHRKFLRKYILRSTEFLYVEQDLRDAVCRYEIDIIVVGSDQIWNYGLFGRDGVDTYFCGFLHNSEVRRVSYAASFGHDHWRFHNFTDRVRANLLKFSKVSVREASGVRICDEVFGRRDCVHVLDPTLLLPSEFYGSMISETAAGDQPALLEYILDAHADKGALTDEALSALGQPHSVRRLSVTGKVNPIDVPNWVAAFKNARFVITDSFHGTVFSIIFRKDFISIVNHKRGNERFLSLLDQLGLQDRLISRSGIQEVQPLVSKPIDFELVHRKIELLQKTSANFLLSALR